MFEQEASDPATGAQRLETLSADLHLRVSVAGNAGAPAHLLERLATDQDERVREQVAGNPNTLWFTLAHLAWEFPHAFLHNPLGPLQLLAHPEQISSDEPFWDALLREADIPVLWWHWLLSHPTLGTCQAVRLHVLSAGEAFHSSGFLQKDERDLHVLERLFTVASAQWGSPPAWSMHPSSDPNTTARQQASELQLSRLAQHADSRVRRAVATNAHTSVEVLSMLAQDQQADVREAVAANPETPVDLLLLMAQDWRSDVRKAVAANAKTPVDLLRTLAQGYGEAQEGVAQNPQTPADLLYALAQDGNIRVRACVAQNPRTPGEVLHLLAQDDRDLVYLSVAGNPQAPAETLRWLAQQYRGKARHVVAANPQTPEKVLRRLARSKHSTVREGVACNEHVPVELLASLAQDEDPRVRQAVAWNGQTSREIISALALDQNPRVRWVVSLLQRLLGKARGSEGEQKWRRKIQVFLRSYYSVTSSWAIGATIGMQLERAATLNVSAHMRQVLLSALAVDWDTKKIQFAFARREQREVLFESGREYYLPLLVPFLPAIALQKLAQSPSWEVRYLVAYHEQTPSETRRHLGQDGNRHVRAMARATAETMKEPTRDLA